MSFIEPTPVNDLPGFYHLRGYSEYGISREGRVRSLVSNSYPHMRRNDKGYIGVSLRRDDGTFHRTTIHTLLAKTFIPKPSSVEDLVVNHINGARTDYRLSNLEWISHIENMHHGMCRNRARGRCSVLVRDAKTGEITHYASTAACGRSLGYSSHAVLNKCQSEGQAIFTDWLQFKLESCKRDWRIPEPRELTWMPPSYTGKGLEMRLLPSEEIRCFTQLGRLADVLKISASVISSMYSRAKLHPVFYYEPYGFFQVRRPGDAGKWREVGDLYLEVADFSRHRPVVAFNPTTKETKIFLCPADCAREMKVTRTNLNWRLKTCFEKEADGFLYGYYTVYLHKYNSVPRNSDVTSVSL